MERDAEMLDILSIVPGIAWPAIPNARASQLLALQFQLERSQWWSPAELAKWQRRQLGVLVDHAYRTVPFYRRRLNALRTSALAIEGSHGWADIPLLTRGDIQRAGQELHCVEAPKGHGPLTMTTTSGSSGQPVITLGTAVTRLFSSALLLRQHLWYRRDLRLKLASIRTRKNQKEGVKESASENWGNGTFDVVRTGPAVGFDVRTSVSEQAEFLLRHDPDYLITYPSVAYALAQHFMNCEQRLTRLRDVRTFGEILEPKVRQACRDVWGVPVVDSYSSEEFGTMAVQCPEHEHYHVQAESVLVEVLDNQDRACRPGEVGRLVITSLHNLAMPLIRYDIGDFAEVGEPCSCGRGLPVLNRIVGRQRNMFLLPGGRRVWPTLEVTPDEAAMLPPLQQFQLVQRTVENVELLLVALRRFTAVEEQFMRQLVDRALGCTLDVKISYVDEIPRGAGGKFEDFRSEVCQA
jgi:phenylacetate-CoA ligase